MLNPSIFYEIFCAVFLLVLGSILVYVLYKEHKRSEERHNTYIETLKSFAHSFKEIQIDC